MQRDRDVKGEQYYKVYQCCGRSVWMEQKEKGRMVVLNTLFRQIVKNLSSKRGVRFLSGIVQISIISVVLSAGSLAYASGTTTKRVYAGDDTSFFHPTVKVEYSNILWGTVDETLTHGECSFMGRYLTRVCARITPPRAAKYIGDVGYDPENPAANEPGDNYGNRTGIEGNPRVQICAYEDPCDGSDPIGGTCFDNLTSPYHEHTSRATAMSRDMMLAIGAAAGGVTIIGNALGVIGAAIAYEILSEYNMIVSKDLGCVDVPIAPSPPEWCHNCWQIPYQPNPTVEINQNATFFSPTVDLRICKNRTDGSQIEPCTSPEAEPRETLSLTPDDSTTQIVDGYPLFEACGRPQNSADGRLFCAKITVARPALVCVYKRTSHADILLRCVDRPEFMPKPTLSRGQDVYSGTRVRVSYPGHGQIDLREDPYIIDGDPTTTPNIGWTQNCGYLQQVQFCLNRPCRTEALDGSCQDYESMICVSGYQSPFGVAVNTVTDAVVAGLPNERQASLNSAWAYNPSHCWQRDLVTGRCLNYENRPNGGLCCALVQDPSDPTHFTDLCPGVAQPYRDSEDHCLEYVRNVAPGDSSAPTDQYVINTAPINPLCTTDRSQVTDPDTECRPSQTLRPLRPQEMGMCLNVPRVTGALIDNGPSTGVYEVPENCGRVEVRMWGGGGAGHADDGGDDDDFTGGSGGYVRVHLDVTPHSTISYRAGSGSTRDWGSGTSSYIQHTYNGRTETITATEGRSGHPDGTNGTAGILDRSSWIWNGTACDASNTQAPCYIHPKTRNGFTGQMDGHGRRGPGGGNAPDYCFTESSIGAEDRCFGSSSFVAPPYTQGHNLTCETTGQRPDTRSEATFLPDEPDGVPSNQYPFMWPGAGGCSFDDPGWEPWGHGAHGRIEFRCISGTGVIGNQQSCQATSSVWVKQINVMSGDFEYFECNLPATEHGFSAPVGACHRGSVPATVDPNDIIERAFYGSPLCDNGQWTY